MPGVSRSVLVTRSASSTTSREFSRIGSHSRCLWVSTAAKPFSISYPSSAMPPCRACVPESTVLHTECVWSTAPPSTLRTIARCSRASAEGRPSPRTTFKIDETANVVRGEGRPSAEALLHLAIVRNVEGGAVLHTHSVWSTVLSGTHARHGGIALEGYEMLKGLAAVETHKHREWLPILENSRDVVE